MFGLDLVYHRLNNKVCSLLASEDYLFGGGLCKVVSLGGCEAAWGTYFDYL